MAKTDKTLQTEKASTGNLPSWDILPPFQFINPRVRTAEKKEETRTNHEPQSSRPIITPAASATTSTLDVVATIPAPTQRTEKCPACGSPVEVDAEFCGECGLRLSDASAANQQGSDEGVIETVKCPNCGEELEFDRSDELVGEFTCPECGNDFTLR
jgi:ribosomal protein L37AE/L43A